MVKLGHITLVQERKEKNEKRKKEDEEEKREDIDISYLAINVAT